MEVINREVVRSVFMWIGCIWGREGHQEEFC
jgi:hypothetical protein